MLKTNKKQGRCKPKDCPSIQWTKLKTDSKNNPICPKCGAPAEMVLGFFGQACWAHKTIKK